MSIFPEAASIILDERGTAALIEIEPTLYSEDVAMRAAYWLTDRGHVYLTKRQDGKLTAEIRLKNGKGGEALRDLCGEFCNSLIDFAVRARVAAETEEIQEALLQRAFVESVPKRPCS